MNAAVAYEETGPESLANEQLTAFVSDAETRATVQTAIGDRWPNAIVHDGGIAAALGILSQDPSPPVLVIDIAKSEDPNASLRSLLALCDTRTSVIAIGEVNDVALYRSIVAQGISDYIVKPIDPVALVSAIDGARRLAPVLKSIETETPSRSVIAVVGARNGVGASTLAVNMGWISAHEHGRTCVIVDLDLQFGTVGLQLDLEPSHGLREALENPDRIDSLFIASAMASESENLFVLSAEEPLEDRVSLSADACTTLMDALPEELDTIVLDMPVRSVIEAPDLLNIADRIVLVTDLSLVGMRDVVRLGRLCAEVAPDAVLHTVLNRAGMAKKGEIPKAEFVKGTDLPIRHMIPFDAQIAALSASSGKPFPLIAGRSPTVKALRALSLDIAGTHDKQETSSGLSRLFSIGRGKS